MKNWVLAGAVLFLMACAATCAFLVLSLLARNRAMAEAKRADDERIEAALANLKASLEEDVRDLEQRKDLTAVAKVTGFYKTQEDSGPEVGYNPAVIEEHLIRVNRYGLGLEEQDLTMKLVIDVLCREWQTCQRRNEEMRILSEVKDERLRQADESKFRVIREKDDRIAAMRKAHALEVERAGQAYAALEEKNRAQADRIVTLEKELAASREKKE
ncbi:MAG: hypothetical protein ACYS47_13605 [Planctomycetota bacterium]|jgi:hypothetical protein